MKEKKQPSTNIHLKQLQDQCFPMVSRAQKRQFWKIHTLGGTKVGDKEDFMKIWDGKEHPGHIPAFMST